ncbi:MAG TPA: hypothetical protein VFS66_09015 [Acidimicrobiia bacterium]|nr:hypothetical protein [Acidimicrobiia bacterium]
MRIRTFTLLMAVALVVAACSPDSASEGSSTTAPVATTSPAPEAVLLSYTLEPGSSFSYEVDMDQSIQMEVEGNPAALAQAEGEEFPESMDLQMVGTTTFIHSVADGPEDGTYEITITGDFSDLEVTGTINGEDVAGNDTMIPEDFTGMEPIEKTIIVDEQGNVITPEDEFGGDIFGDLGGMGGLGMLEDFGAGGSPGQFIGPPLSDEPVTVGDTWTNTFELPMMPGGGEEISTTIVSEVVSSEQREGVEVFVIETTTSTSAIEFDFAEILIGFMTAFVPEGATDEELAEMEALTESLKFAFSVDPTEVDMTTWFDPEAGHAVEAHMINDSHVVMDIAMPDEVSGELVEVLMDMTIGSDVTYRLVDSTGGDA